MTIPLSMDIGTPYPSVSGDRFEAFASCLFETVVEIYVTINLIEISLAALRMKPNERINWRRYKSRSEIRKNSYCGIGGAEISQVSAEYSMHVMRQRNIDGG